MTKYATLLEALEAILADDSRYHVEAYNFVREGLDHTMQLLNKPQQGTGRHVRGQDLLEGLRSYALQEFGPIAHTVLKTWGIHRCEDFGEIVFNMVESGILGKTEEDSHQDFAGGYDFKTAFRAPFLPDPGRPVRKKTKKTTRNTQPKKTGERNPPAKPATESSPPPGAALDE